MSNRRPTRSSSKSAQKMRGPSRPVNPRYAQRYATGRPQRRGPDTFAIVLVGASALIVLGLLFFVATRQQSNTAATAGTTPGTSSQQVDPAATQTAQENAFLVATANLPRITPQEAKALYDANNVKFIDVREKGIYDTQHIKGALNIPQADAAKRVAEIPKAGNVILYCQ